MISDEVLDAVLTAVIFFGFVFALGLGAYVIQWVAAAVAGSKERG